MTDNFDYRKPRIQIEDLFPDIFKTDINVSVLNNAENRLLSKPDTIHINGTVGKKNPQLPITNRIIENDSHRQAWQLQPLLYNKIATADHITSYYDILKKLEQLGIDIDSLPYWGNTLQFNYAPPIDIDKLINYSNYYWYDTQGVSKPQYITIENQYITFNSQLIELRKYYNDRVAASASTAELNDIKQTINQIFTKQQEIRNKHVGFDVTLWDDNGGDWDPLQNWVTAGLDADNQVVPVTEPTGSADWDTSNIDMLNMWSLENKWVHESDLVNSAGGIQATMPIIEYNANLEINEWTYTSYKWMYRKDLISGWVDVDVEPTPAEMYIRYNIIDIAPDSDYLQPLNAIGDIVYIVLGDMVSLFVPGYQFVVSSTISNNGVKTTYNSVLSDNGLFTIIYINEPVILESAKTPLSVPYNDKEFLGDNVQYGVIVPITATSLGDMWQGFFFHWKLIEANDTVPVNHQTPNLHQKRYIAIVTNTGFDVGEFDTGLEQERSVNGTFMSETIIINPRTIYPITHIYQLNNETKYLNNDVYYTSYDDIPLVDINDPNINDFQYWYNMDDLQVYINGIRQYGNYEEIATNSIYSTAIKFTNILKTGDIVQFRSGAACSLDVGREMVWVNTQSDIVQTSLIKYKKFEQVKSQHTQYPLFDIYDVDGTTAYKANCIFKYEEKNTNAVDNRVDMRITVINNGRDYMFNQLLVNPDTDEMYCYKDYDTISVDSTEGLQTIWKKGLNNEEYTPRYVNEYRLADGDTYLDANSVSHTVTLPIGDENGAWEIPDQLYYNAIHENKYAISYTNVYTHFRTIIEGQNTPSFMFGNTTVPFDFISKPNQFKLLDNINYGLGGTIKEHNGCYDMFLSAMYQNIITVPSLIKYAHQQYDNSILLIKEIFTKNFLSIITDTSPEAVLNFQQNVIDKISAYYLNNDNLTKVFSDTTAYDATTGLGMPNWIATLPILQFVYKQEPHLLIDEKIGLYKLKHHDGHFSDNQYSATELKNIINNILAAGGLSGTGTKPNLQNLTNGTFWYDTQLNQLWKYNVIAIQNFNPPITTPLGVYWYNDETQTLYVRSNSTSFGWDIETNQELAWILIDFNEIISNTLLTIETKLYEKCEDITSLKIDYANLYNTNTSTHFTNLMEEEYINYAKSNNLNIYYTDYSASDPWTWNYTAFPTLTDVTINYPSNSTEWGSRWYSIYAKLYNTAYPHLEPWKLQGYITKPDNWDELYADTTGAARWKIEMWDNIKAGITTGVSSQPTTAAPLYNDRLCVNITNTTIDGFDPGDLLPPYTASVGLQPYTLVSYTTFTSDIQTAISQGYAFGQRGPIEQQWRESSNYLYNVLLIAFKMQPIRFIQQAFGLEFYEINKLQIEKLTKKIISHGDTQFHGLLKNELPEIISINGINQWYVNAIRSKEFDIHISDFLSMWRDWTLKLTYQTDSTINSKSLVIGTDFYHIGDQDYTVYMKKSPGIYDSWINALIVSLYQVGTVDSTVSHVQTPARDGADWMFRIDVPVNTGDAINIYDVNNYTITNVNDLTNEITIDRASPWIDGDQISLSSTIKNIKYAAPYFIIKESDTIFKLATSYNDSIARNNDVIVYDTINHTITTDGSTPPSSPNDLDLWSYIDAETGDPIFKQYHKLSNTWQLYSSSYNIFRIQNDTSPTNLRIYYDNALLIENIDYTVFPNNWIQLINGLNFIPTQTSLVIKSLLPIGIPMYSRYTTFVALDQANCDIKWTHYTINKNNVISINMPIIITGVQNVINFVDGYASYLQDHGFAFSDYLTTSIDEQTGRIVSWQTEIEKFIDKAWRGFNTKFDISTQQLTKVYDSHEINPFRYDLWVAPQYGILSNIISGPFVDISSQPIVYDQYGTPILSIDNLKIFREDKLTYFTYPRPSELPYEKTSIHIGGMHLFSDEYEHIIALNNYTVDNELIYDPYIGLNISKIQLQFDKHYERTGRPNLGGYFLKDGVMIENMEAAATNLNHYYDVYTSDETADHIDYARALLGYREPSYLDLLGINSKSKFIFWRGMIQHNGSNTAITAFNNSRLLSNASIDEFWAYELGEFGDSRTKIKPTINILLTDIQRGSIAYQFTNATDTIVEQYFTNIANTDVNRWRNLPDADYLTNDSMYFDAEVTTTLNYTHNEIVNALAYDINVSPLINRPAIRTSLFDTNTHQFLEMDVCDGVQIFVDDNISTIVTASSIISTLIIPDVVNINTVDVTLTQPQNVDQVILNEINTILYISGQTTYDVASLLVYVRNSDGEVFQITTFSIVGSIITIPTKYDTINVFTVYVNKTLSITTDDSYTNRFTLTEPYLINDGDITLTVSGAPILFNIETIIVLPYHYILGANNLKVYVDDIVNNNYIEVNDNTIMLSGTPYFSLSIIKQQAKLSEWSITNPTGHYKILSTTLIEFLIDISDGNIVNELSVFLLNPAVEKLNSCKLIDIKSNVITKEIPVWDPLRGHYPTNVDLMVDYYSAMDPAIYNSSINDLAGYDSYKQWNSQEIGKIWLDTSKLGYVPYNDCRLYPTINDRIFAWGDMPNWSHIEVYEWVSSPVLPIDWATLVANDVNNTTIDEKDRYSGEAFMQLYYRTRSSTTADWGDWQLMTDTYMTFNGYDYDIIDGAITVAATELSINTTTDKYEIYVNEQIITSYTTNVDSNDIITSLIINGVVSASRIRIVKYAANPTQEQIDELNQNVDSLLNYSQIYPYTSTYVYDSSGITRLYTYYFWVKNRTNRNKNNLSIIDIKHLFDAPQNPYIFYQHLLYDDGNLPNRYDQCVIANIAYDINEGGRYNFQFTRDLTLRDQLANNTSLKNKHIEWKMFRQNETSLIPRHLWDKITETLLGYKLNNINNAIPSSNRVLFDNINNTTTRYGFGEDQAVGDKTIIMNSLIAQLNDSNYDFQPINKENFLELYTFTDATSIMAGMNYIYTKFPSNITNKLFFDILNDALTYNHELAGIFKTSMVALDCTLTFETPSSVRDV